MSLIEELRSMGLDVDEGLGRVMGDEDLYAMMLGMFVDQVQSPIQPEEFDSADLDELIRKVHGIKGTTGNLSLTPLFEGYNEALTLLRAGKPKDAKAVYTKIMPVQADIIDCIKRNGNA